MDNRLVKINENTYSFEDGFVRCFLLIGTQKALWVDSGVTGANLIEIAKEVTSLPLELINTHGDGDHTASNGLFASFYMHTADYDGCGLAGKYPNSKLVAIKEGDSIDLGNRVLEIYDIAGHTKGSIAILDKEAKLIITGDSVGKEHIFLFGKHRAPELFTAALEKIISLNAYYDHVLASHGEMLLPADSVSEVLKDYQKVLEGKVEAKEMELHGTIVKSYDVDYCGFYLG